MYTHLGIHTLPTVRRNSFPPYPNPPPPLPSLLYASSSHTSLSPWSFLPPTLQPASSLNAAQRSCPGYTTQQFIQNRHHLSPISLPPSSFSLPSPPTPHLPLTRTHQPVSSLTVPQRSCPGYTRHSIIHTKHSPTPEHIHKTSAVERPADRQSSML